MRLLLMASAVALSLATAHLAMTRALAVADPELAWSLGPVATAGQAAVTARVAAQDADLDAARRIAEDVADSAPVLGRTWSLLAELDRLSGDPEGAAGLVDAALELKPTEMLASLRRMERSVVEGRTEEGVERLDAFLRRHPEHAPLATGVVGPVLSTPSGYGALVAMLRTEPEWAGSFLSNVADLPDGTDYLYRVVLDLEGADRATVAEAVRTLHAHDRSDLAHRLFLARLSADERAVSGYVHDPHFAMAPDGSLFTWRLGSTAGAEASWRKASDGEGGSISVRFANQPVREIDVSQIVALPPGRYIFRTRYVATRLQAPKGIQWTLRCRKPSRELLALPIGTEQPDATERTVEFVVDGTCPVATLQLGPVDRTTSFRHRYDGAIEIREATIERADA